TWGAAQAGVASGVLGAVADGVIPIDAVDDLLLIAAVWVNPEADSEAAVFDNNRQAARAALESGRLLEPRIEDLLAVADAPQNPYFGLR
ncbi:MAG TPA: formaldehyde-activating enzyme, partial [Acidimicrobiales bacterium]|nr:formaldehyde-activating enzyme [Acidimicrobiales bacterium]